MPDDDASSVTIAVVRRHPDARLPSYAHDGDAGLDLSSVADVDIPPGGRVAVPTGLALAIPDGWVGLIHPRSGLARRQGLTVANAPGTIDAGYRGEIEVLLVNLGDKTVTIGVGDRVAQLVVQRVGYATVVEVGELGETARGDGGFGSTGTGASTVEPPSR
ncbi:MAG: dUTP diphosphatase [Nitriliruptoraceae bacterium]